MVLANCGSGCNAPVVPTGAGPTGLGADTGLMPDEGESAPHPGAVPILQVCESAQVAQSLSVFLSCQFATDAWFALLPMPISLRVWACSTVCALTSCPVCMAYILIYLCAQSCGCTSLTQVARFWLLLS